MRVVAYIDESGTHDRTGIEKGSREAVIAGLVGWREDWVKFSAEWRDVLDKYGAPYFHFKEWSEASRFARGVIGTPSNFFKNPYHDWKLEQLDAFLFELADLAGSGNRVIVGGWIDTALFHKEKAMHPQKAPCGGDPYKYCLRQFFTNLPKDILSVWPFWKEPVSIVFDQNDNPTWTRAAMEAYDICRQKETRFQGLSFENKKMPEHVALQAADMVVYRFRQLAENANKNNLRPPSKLDLRLLKQFGSIQDNPFLR